MWGRAFLCLLTVALAAPSARAEDDDADGVRQKPQQRSPAANFRQVIGADEVDGPSIFEGIPALNPIDAFRDRLRDRFGVYLHGAYVGDPYGDLGGGMRRGATFSGRLDVEVDIDTAKTIGVPNGTVHANMFQIHGRDLSRDFVGNFLTSNDVAALPSTKLYELWYEQSFGDELSVRAGQQGIDVEFLTSSYGGNFIDATFGWPALPSENLPDGGPAYPLAAPALRVKYKPTKNVAILAAVFDGKPAGPCAGEPQACDPTGTNFRVSDPPLAILEAQIRYNQGEQASGLPGRVKLGAFGYFGRADDQRFAFGGVPLALGGQPLTHALNGGAYGIIDQQVYRLPDAGARDDDKDTKDDGRDDDTAKGIGVFARVIGAPADRNPVDLYADAGVSALGLVPGRPNDQFGIAAAVAKISGAAIAADEAAVALGDLRVARSFEAVFEATYQAEVVPGFSLQPTFQYVIHPGGNVANPYAANLAPIPDAEIFGVTTIVRF